jgi:tetratricopeptide (TPR) repeat protein
VSAHPATSVLKVSGTVDFRSQVYIVRPADDVVLRLLRGGEYCNVLCSRQMGKSSLMNRAEVLLANDGFRSVSIDVAGCLGTVPAESADLWYHDLLREVTDQLRLTVDVSEWWQSNPFATANRRLISFFQDLVAGLVDKPVVVFLDEIDSTLKLPFADELFVALRSMYNERAKKPALRRITFCLVGVATPNELIKDPRTTPYNVGRTIELTDFDRTRDDLGPLHRAVSDDPKTGSVLVEEVLRWTGGHPYLTVKLCDELAQAGATKQEDVARLVESMFQDVEAGRSDVHFQAVLRMFDPNVRRIAPSEDAMALYRGIWRGRKEPDQLTPAHNLLKLSGLVKHDRNGLLVVRNPIYRQIFNQNWAESGTHKRVHKPNNLPFSSLGSLFKGRGSLLEELHGRLNVASGPAAAFVGRQALYGLGGVGKTRAAVEYAWRYADDYNAIFFVSSPTAGDLRTRLADLAGLLDVEAGAAVDDRLDAVLRGLEKYPGWLLILDNVDTPDAAREAHQLLAKLRSGHVLITSRISNWSTEVEPLELDVLAEADAVSFLLERTSHRRRAPDDAGHAAAIARQLDSLALALEQAGAYIDNQKLSLAEYLRRWEAKGPEVLRWHDPRLMQYPTSVAVTWQTTFAQLTVPEQRLLQVLAWLAPEPIPLLLLDAAPLLEAIPNPRESLACLAGYSLVRFAVEGDTVEVHRLVQEIIRSSSSAADRAAALQIALMAVNAVAPYDANDVRTWEIWTPLAAHAGAVIWYADAAGLAKPTSGLMNQLGLYWQTRGQFRAAEPLYRRALAIGERSYGPDHPEVAFHLNNLADLLRITNRLDEAEPLYRRVLQIFEASLGTDHPNVATALNNLASLLQDTNRLDEAEPLYRRALEISDRSYGRHHPNVATALNNLAGLLQDTNRLDEAEPLYRQALEISDRSYGPDHPNVAICLNNLAGMLRSTNRLGEAEPLCRRALEISERSYGPDHPNVATALNNLAGLLQDTSRLDEAELLYRRVLQVFEASLGTDHPNVATALNNLAGLLQDTNRLDEAEPLYRRALEISEQSYGRHHPKVATALNNLAGLLQDTNRLDEAVPLSLRTLQIFIQFTHTTGHEHPHLRNAIVSYKSLLEAMDYSSAEIRSRLSDLGRLDGVLLADW